MLFDSNNVLVKSKTYPDLIQSIRDRTFNVNDSQDFYESGVYDYIVVLSHISPSKNFIKYCYINFGFNPFDLELKKRINSQLYWITPYINTFKSIINESNIEYGNCLNFVEYLEKEFNITLSDNPDKTNIVYQLVYSNKNVFRGFIFTKFFNGFNDIKIECEIDITKLNLNNFKKKLKHYVNLLDNICSINLADEKKFLKITSFILSDVYYSIKIKEDELKILYYLLRNCNIDLLSEAENNISRKDVEKRFDFLIAKIRNIKELKINQAIILNNKGYNKKYFYFKNFPGLEFSIQTVDDLFKLECILYCCNLHSKYLSLIREAILTYI